MMEHIVSESLTEMKYSEHLKELRKRLIYSIGIVLAIFFIITSACSEELPFSCSSFNFITS